MAIPKIKVNMPGTNTLQFDSSTLLGRYLGQVSTGTSNGSTTHAGFAQGTPWWVILQIGSTGLEDASKQPTVSVAGTTLSWTFGGGGGYNYLIVFGVM